MIPFTKAHAYGNDFLYVPAAAVERMASDRLACALCDRHTGIGADGLVLYTVTANGASMTLLNADGSPSEVSGNGVRGLAAILLRNHADVSATTVVSTDAGAKTLTRTAHNGARQTFVASMGAPRDLRRVWTEVDGSPLELIVLNFGNPQCVVLGPLPDLGAFHRMGPALERHELFPARTNVEFAHVERADLVRILIWERGVGPTTSSGTGSCAALIAAVAFGGANRQAQVAAPGGTQRVDWREDGVYLTGDAEILFDGTWISDRTEIAY